MTQYEAIFERKSCREYQMDPILRDELDSILKNMTAQPTLNEEPVRYVLNEPGEMRGLFHITAPHYITAYGSGTHPEREALTAGFQMQLWTLWMHTCGYGTVWLGGSRPIKDPSNQKRLMTIAFGKGTEPISRKQADFKRKEKDDISIGEDPRLEAARLAQSGTNSQPWYFVRQEKNLYVYAKAGSLSRFVYPFPEVDMGIVLAHLFLASRQGNMQFSFSDKAQDAPAAPKGYRCIGVCAG